MERSEKCYRHNAAVEGEGGHPSRARPSELTAGVDCAGLRTMHDDAQEFSRLVGAVLARFLAQNGSVVSATFDGEALGARLWQVVFGHERLGSAEAAAGKLGGWSEEECASLVARVLGGAEDALLATAVRQLVKACLYPELKSCRDSFREIAADGTCRRQELARVRGRVSGTHCVDCPHWVALTPAQHATYLKREWHGAVQGFTDHQAVFLPEDFRALRCWLHARKRVRSSGAQ